jgi:hypothetical protein
MPEETSKHQDESELRDEQMEQAAGGGTAPDYNRVGGTTPDDSLSTEIKVGGTTPDDGTPDDDSLVGIFPSRN